MNETYTETPEERAERKAFEAEIRALDGESELEFHDQMTWRYAKLLRDDRRLPEFEGLRQSFRQHIHLLEDDLGIPHVDLDLMELIHQPRS